jgi:pyruvate kinase
MNKFTKIVATVSDKRCDTEFIKALYENGLNVVRMNSAHLEYEGFSRIVNNVRAVSSSIGILMDTKGAEIRTTTNVNDEVITFVPGDKVTFIGDPTLATTHDTIYLSYPGIANDIQPGIHFLIDDGEIDFEIDSVDGDTIYATAKNGGKLGSRKSVNVPGAHISLPSLTERDRRNIGYAIELGVDFIAHSFVQRASDVLDIQKILDEHKSPIKIISKIENQAGIDNFDEILEVSYGIMIARGDLGIEVAAEKIPGIQSSLINKCIYAHKPVIVATQMLHSMINNPRPTRAEVSDIANAVNQHTDALMLSGETAYGKYPIEAIATMTKVAAEVEKSLVNSRITPTVEPDVTSFLARQAVASSKIVNTRAIITDSYTGRTARYISSYRGSYPTLAICYYKHVVRLLALSYGVIAVYQHRMSSSRIYLKNALAHIIESRHLTHDDRIAYLGGSYGEGHGTTFLEINRVGEIMDNFDCYDLPNLEQSTECQE